MITTDEKQTMDLGKNIAKGADGGDIFALFGDLGSGKTTFTKGFAKGIGVSKEITSPTFVISKAYPVSDNEKIDKFIHLDCYRLSGVNDAEMIGLSEYLEDEKAVLLIEWPEQVWPLIEKRAKKIRFKYVDELKREIIY